MTKSYFNEEDGEWYPVDDWFDLDDRDETDAGCLFDDRRVCDRMHIGFANKRCKECPPAISFLSQDNHATTYQL